MGFLSFDKKAKNTTNTYDQSENITTTAGDNRVSGDNSITGGNVTANSIGGDVTLTDFGAIEQGVGLAKGSLDFASNALANSLTFADTSGTNALLFGKEALDANKEANELTAGIAGKSIDSLFEANKSALNFANSFGSKALDTVENISDNTNSTLVSGFGKFTDGVNNAINKVSDVVKGANTSDSVATIKYIGFAVVGIAVAVYVLPNLLKKG